MAFFKFPAQGAFPAPGSAVGAESEAAFPSSSHLRWCAAMLMAYFGLRLLFLATTISPMVPPDETTHFGLCTIFSRFPLLPVNSPDSYQYGLVTNIPWLYYWIMGKLLCLNFLGISDLVYLRLLNIPLAFGLVYYVWRTLRLVTEDRLCQILLLTAMTNTMMLTFLSAFVSYDNLANLLAAMSIYYLLAFFKDRSPALLAASFICQLAGCLTKLTFLPLMFVLILILAVHEVKNLPGLASGIGSFFRRGSWRSAIMTLALLFLLALNFQVYGLNYLHHNGKLTLETTDVLPLESALQYRLTARGYIFRQFQQGRVSKAQALEMTSRINHPGDRADAVFMIENFEKFKSGARPTIGLPEYIPLWGKRMAAGIFGIFGHLAMPNNWPTIAPIWLLAALATLGFLRRWRPWDAGWLPSSLAVIAGFYGAVILYEFNYQNYLDNGAPFVALQGRYIFPVLGPIYLLASVYLLRLFQGRSARLAVFALAAFIFIISDFPLFLARITPEWAYWPSN